MGKKWIIVGFTVVLAFSSLVLIIGYHPLDSAQQEMSASWMFIGAYATYEGKIPNISNPYSTNLTMQVTEVNATHIQIQTNSSISTSFAPTLSDQTTIWVNKTNINFQPPDETFAGTYSTKITVKNIGTRDCIAYDYTNQAINATYYIDKALLWPVRIVYATAFENQTYHMDFSLKNTNINGLN
jgi:hypothetical protein